MAREHEDAADPGHMQRAAERVASLLAPATLTLLTSLTARPGPGPDSDGPLPMKAVLPAGMAGRPWRSTPQPRFPRPRAHLVVEEADLLAPDELRAPVEGEQCVGDHGH